ncbi:hypothetical protein K439DRAFT_1617931 [Ramaria rubella]|nr:hypothetical protein K439DRAFT_1617931 [Ramaria rubella]
MPSQSYEERPSNDKGPGIPAFDNCCVLKTLRDINYRLTKWGSSADHRGVVGPSQGSSSFSLPPYTSKGRGCGFGGGSGSSTSPRSIFTIPQLPLASTARTQSGGPVNTTGPSVPRSSTAPTSMALPSNQLALDSQGTRLHTTASSTSTKTTPHSLQNLLENVTILPAVTSTPETNYMGIRLAFGMHSMLAVYTTGMS